MIVGLDIGTSKVVAIVGEVSADGRLEIVGLGSHQSRGLKKGVVVNIESTVQSIQRAVEEAELMAGCHIHSVYAGIAGSHIRSLNSHGIVAIRDREVYPLDVERVIDAAQAVAIPADQKILHILPQEYVIDSRGYQDIKDKLLFGLTNAGQPAIYVEDANFKNRGELYLLHDYQGVPLKIDSAKDTLVNLFRIWGRPVHLETATDKRRRLLSYDGSRHEEKLVK